MHRAKAHIRVTGVSQAVHHSFRTLNEAKAFLHREGHIQYDTDVKSENEDTSPRYGRAAYYAVANGRAPGVYRYY